MDRRNFMRSILGVAAATALPSEVWPFRKIFLPTPPIIWETGEIFPVGLYAGAEQTYLASCAVEAIELEAFAKQIPNLIYKSSSLYEFFKKDVDLNVDGAERTRIPIRIGGFTLVV
jgi:hypothetical protein